MTKQVTPELKEEVVRLYREGKSAREISREVSREPKLSHQTVLNVCREAGVEIRPPYYNKAKPE